MSAGRVEKKTLQTASGSVVYYIDRVETKRPPVVLLHGLSSNHTTWLNVMQALHDSGYTSIAPDMRGHGHSDKTKQKNLYTFPTFSHDLHELLAQEGIVEAVIVGYSFGGQVAIDYAARYPDKVKGLVLVSVTHENPFGYHHLGFLTPLLVGSLNLLAALLLWQQRKAYHYYEHGKAVGFWDSVWDGLRTMPISINFWMLAQAIGVRQHALLARIIAPTLIFTSAHDPYITAAELDDMHRGIADSDVIVSRDASHFVGTNAQAETTQVILDFLRTHENSNL